MVPETPSEVNSREESIMNSPRNSEPSLVSFSSHKLHSENFLQWSRSVRLFITGKGKEEYITGDCKAPVKTDPLYKSRHPSVKWAQRSDVLFITIELPDAQDVKLNLEPDGKFQFSATAGPDKSLYEVNFDLFDKVDVNESKTSSTSRSICYLVKKAESKWWSRLVKQEGKPPVFLKVDWDKWVDEDEQDEQAGNDFGDIDFSKLNMGGDGDLGGDDFGDDVVDDDEEDDSDTEDETKEASTVETSESLPPGPASVVEAADAKA